MAWKPPIDRRGKKELLKSERFYRRLTEECQFLDRDTALVFYAALISVVGQELRRFGVVRLPHLADIALVPQKPRIAWVGQQQRRIDGMEVLKMYPKEKLRRYFNKRQKIT